MNKQLISFDNTIFRAECIQVISRIKKRVTVYFGYAENYISWNFASEEEAEETRKEWYLLRQNALLRN